MLSVKRIPKELVDTPPVRTLNCGRADTGFIAFSFSSLPHSFSRKALFFQAKFWFNKSTFPEWRE